MRIFNSPRPGRCASCEFELTGRPIYRLDEAYCCIGCVAGGPCVCNYEADLADDGVDGLGLPFAMSDVFFGDPTPVGVEAAPRGDGPPRLGNEPLATEAVR